MTWRCPACSQPIRHDPHDVAPTPGIVYRCSVCRLELLVDEQAQKMIVAPLDATKATPLDRK